MLINTTDITTYKAKQLNVDIQPTNIAIAGDWLKKSLLPIVSSKNKTFKPIKVEIIVQDDTREATLNNISNLMANLTDQVDLTLDGYPHKYKCTLTSSEIQKTVNTSVMKLLLAFQGYEYGTEVTELANRVYTKTINLVGNSESPCIVEITPSINATDIAITGLSEDNIVIGNLTQSQKIIINGEDGTITQGGLNKFADTTLFWEFPKLQPGSNVISFNRNSCDITIKYKPRYV